MKLRDVYNEDVKSDKNHLADAKRAWAEILQQVKKFLEKKNLTEFDYFEKTYDDLFGPLTLKPFNVSVSGEEYQVHFERRKGTVNGRMRTFKNMHTGNIETFDIVLFQTFENEMDLISYADFENQLTETFRSAFIHEYTHLADVMRSRDRKRYTNTKKSQVKSGHYINTAHEFNAFYTQVLDDAERLFGTRDVQNLFKKDPDFKTFLGLLRSGSEATMALDSESSGKYRQSFMKRLYQLYQDYKNEMLD